MAVLVTGGAGYIGSHVAHALLKRGEGVVVLDNLSRGSRTLVPPGCVFVEGDVGDRIVLRKLFTTHPIESVIHLAAFVSVEESMHQPQMYYRNNRDKTSVLMQMASAYRVLYFVFSSTAAVYGQPDIVPVPESAPLIPINPYGDSKLQAEQALAKERKRFAAYSILRYFNVAGGGYVVGTGATHLIRRAILAAVGKVPHLDVFGTDYDTPDGTCVRDYIQVDDLADAHVVVLRHLREKGASHVFNCGYGQGFSVLQVVEAVKRVSGVDFVVRLKGRRVGDSGVIVADASKLRAMTSWQPRYEGNLDGIVEHELTWVRKQLSSS